MVGMIRLLCRGSSNCREHKKTKVATQHDALIWPVLPSFSKRLLWYTLRNSGFSRASLAGQLKDTVRRGFDSSFGNFVHYLDACSGHAFFMLELFENGSMVSLLGGEQSLRGRFLFNRSV
jgi:hypothetical protein